MKCPLPELSKSIIVFVMSNATTPVAKWFKEPFFLLRVLIRNSFNEIKRVRYEIA